MTHLRSIIPLSVVNEALSFDWREIPGEIARLLRVNERNLYYPVFYLDELSFRVKVMSIHIARLFSPLPRVSCLKNFCKKVHLGRPICILLL